MARLRTPEEREAIALECIKLEQEGGDILAYLWSQDYVTPRATWCNIQRQYLNRKPYEYTDGKPRKTGRKYKPMPRKGDMKAVAEAVAERIEAGEDYQIYMEGLGYKEPAAALSYIRKQLKKTDPELVERLYVRKPYIHEDMTLPAGVVHKPMTDEEIEELTRPYRPEEDEPEITTRESSEKAEIYRFKDTDKQTLYGKEPKLTPVAFDGMVGEWRKESDGTISLSKQREGKFFFMKMEMSLTATEWMAICAEIPRVIEKMGLQEAARED